MMASVLAGGMFPMQVMGKPSCSCQILPSAFTITSMVFGSRKALRMTGPKSRSSLTITLSLYPASAAAWDSSVMVETPFSRSRPLRVQCLEMAKVDRFGGTIA